MDLINKATIEAARLRDEKQKIVDQILQQLVKEGSITEEEAESIKQTQKELLLEEELTAEKQKQLGLEKATNIEGKTGAPEPPDPEPTKKSFLQKITAATLYYAALRNLRKIMTTVITTVKELDKSVSEVAMVTNLTREQS